LHGCQIERKMVVKIVSGTSIRGLLNYNENKVTEGIADLLMASRFGAELDQLNFIAKLNRFQHLTDLNSRVKTNSIHIMLNFDSAEHLNPATLQQIASEYMERIGFGEQPYLVYRHKDASHPHLHIVTTNMQADGTRINIHNLGKTLSETARKELEIEFNLVKAEGRHNSNTLGITPASVEAANYGKTPTKRAINNVVGIVVQNYKFTSLAELNAILKQFNVTADRGKADSQMFERRGLVYSILDEKGNRIGIPFKASALSGKPTLNNLEKLFEANKEKRLPYKETLKRQIDNVFGKYSTLTKATFIAELQKQNINVVFRENDQGLVYGLTFIDNRNKTVFNGSDLGKAYAAKAILEKFSSTDKLLHPEQKTYLKAQATTNYLKRGEPSTTYLKPVEPTEFLKIALSKTGPDQAPSVPKKKKKKRVKGQQEQLEL
jgi:hypothetical protein